MARYAIEIDNPTNGGLNFRPLGRTVRGRFSLARSNDPDLMNSLATFSGTGTVGVNVDIPGQRLVLDTDRGRGAVEEPLHSPDHRAVRQSLRARGLEPPAEGEEVMVPPEAQPSWLYWMARAVEAGLARSVGADPLPASSEVKGKVRKDYVHAERHDDRQRSRDTLLALLVADLPKDKQARAAELLADAIGG